MATAQFQYTRLAYQAQAVSNIEQVLHDVRFIAPENAYANPIFKPAEACEQIRANIQAVRSASQIGIEERITVSSSTNSARCLRRSLCMSSTIRRRFAPTLRPSWVNALDCSHRTPSKRNCAGSAALTGPMKVSSCA